MTKRPIDDPIEKGWKRTLKRVRRYYRLFRKTIWGFVLLIGGALAYKFLPLLYFSTLTQPPISVSTEIVKGEDWAREIPVIGSLSAVNSVILSNEVGGIVQEIGFESGQDIRKGGPIIGLTDDVEKADLKRYEAQLSLSKVTLSRSKQLVKTAAESHANRDTKLAQYEETEALVQQAKAIIEKKNITAPFAGKLGIRQVGLGQYLQPGTPIVTLTDLNKLYVNFNVSERFRTILAVGQKIRFRVEAFPQKDFEGTITTIEPQISEETRNVTVQATYDNKGLDLSPGMFTDVRIILPQKETIISVPETAINYGLYGDSVYGVVVNRDTGKERLIAKRLYVKVGDHRKGRVAILSGLEAGQRIVTHGQVKLDDGAIVSLSADKGPQIPEHLTNE
jgi:multidrug efflux system membrane fusion protein